MASVMPLLWCLRASLSARFRAAMSSLIVCPLKLSASLTHFPSLSNSCFSSCSVSLACSLDFCLKSVAMFERLLIGRPPESEIATLSGSAMLMLVFVVRTTSNPDAVSACITS